MVSRAQEKGYATLESIEDRGNQAAITLERQMDFRVEPVEGEPTLARVRRQLR